MLPEAAKSWAPWIGGLAVIGIIYGALGCLAQKDMKRLIAFSSVAHMGFVMLAISTMTSFGINAAIFGMVAHGLITGMLFFIAGSVQHNYGTREMSRLGGLLVSAPKMGWILGFCVMASLGLPGLAGFWGEFPAILSSFNPAPGLSEPLFRFYMVVAAVGTVFAAGYLLWMLQKVAFGTPKAEFEHAHIHDVSSFEWTAWVADPRPDPRARHLPQHRLPRDRRRGDAHDRRDRGRDPMIESSLTCSPPPTSIPNPVLDWHALAPEIIIVATIAAVLVADLLLPDRDAWQTSRIASIGVLAALVPVVTLAASGHDRYMFDGAYAVDHYAIALKGFFLVATYITILLAVDYIDEGDYYKGEFYALLLTSTFGLMIMASARDLITLFVALETISIPTFILAAFRKYDRKSNEAGVKYYLIGVLSSALMLYGMSLIFGVTGTTTLSGISA